MIPITPEEAVLAYDGSSDASDRILLVKERLLRERVSAEVIEKFKTLYRERLRISREIAKLALPGSLENELMVEVRGEGKT